MCAKVAIVYNEPVQSRYHATGEEKAEIGVLEAVNAVKKSMFELQHEVRLIALVMPLEKAEAVINNLNVDVVFNLFEGFTGFPETEPWLPELLGRRGIAYTGCPPDILRLALNKAKTKEVLKEAGIQTAKYQILTPDTVDYFRMEFPCIVKPVAEDASHGLTEDSLVNDLASLDGQVRRVSELFGGRALVEEFLSGREFNATVMGNVDFTVLPISEITYNLPQDKPRILTFAAKWELNSLYYRSTPVICPAKIDEQLKNDIGRTALAAFKATGCRGYARVDMRLDKYGTVNVIEVNPNPDISPNTGAARQAKAAGMTYSQFINRIIALANEKIPV